MSMTYYCSVKVLITRWICLDTKNTICPTMKGSVGSFHSGELCGQVWKLCNNI